MKKWDIEMTYGIGFSVCGVVAETQDEAIQKARHLVEQGTTVLPFDNSVDERDLEFEQVTYIQGR